MAAVWTLFLRPPISLASAPWCPPVGMAPCLVGAQRVSSHLVQPVKSGLNRKRQRVQSLPCKPIAPVAQNPAEPRGTEAAGHPRETHPSSHILPKKKKHKIRTFQTLPGKLMHSVFGVMASNCTAVFKAWSKGTPTVWLRPRALRVGEPEYSLMDCTRLMGLL